MSIKGYSDPERFMIVTRELIYPYLHEMNDWYNKACGYGILQGNVRDMPLAWELA